MSLFTSLIKKSTGLKRQIASLLLVLIELARSTPVLSGYVIVLEQLATLFGATGATHAAIAGTLDKHKVSSIASILAVLLGIGTFVPALTPYLPILQKIASLLGAVSLGIATGSQSS